MTELFPGDDPTGFLDAERIPLRADLLVDSVTARPGEPVTLQVQVLNTTSVIETLDVALQGLPPDQLRVSPPQPTLFPGESITLDIELQFYPTLPAGVHDALVEISGSSSLSAPTRVDLRVEVPAVPALVLDAEPPLARGGKRAVFDVQVRNSGNTPLSVLLRATDEDRVLDLHLNNPSLRLPVDGWAGAILIARGKRPWTGQPREHVITITAEQDLLQQTAEVRFRQKPRLTAGVITVFTLAMILSLWAAAMFFGVTTALAGEDPTRSLPETFSTGTGLEDLDPAVVGGQVLGTVRAASTAAGLPRVTIEAYGLDGELATATATDEEGAFALAGLLPNRYRLQIRADGFDAVWWPDAADPADAEEVALAPGGSVDDLDVVLTGRAGALGGQAFVGDEAPTEIVVEVSAVDLQQEQAPVITTTDEVGLWSVDGLATPATYRVVYRAEGYAPTELIETLPAGEQLTLNTVRLEAAEGSIAGEVTDTDGNLLGGVEVLAQRGDTEVSTITPTSGEVGLFRVSDLETPGTYLLTFRLEGFSSETLAIRLGPGEVIEDLPVRLAAATGTVTGRAVGADGSPLGGVRVLVSGGGTVLETDTFTSGDIGSFRVSGLPLPGIYTVTFELDGFGRETSQIRIDRDTPNVTVQGRLVPERGRIEGRVVDADDAPVVGAEVVVSDGARDRETTTATAPAAQRGRFAVGDLAPGSYTVTVTAPDGRTLTQLHTVTANEVTEVTMTLGAGP